MEKVAFFKSDNLTKDYCCGETYYKFLDYAFSKTDFFMLVYVNYYSKGYTKEQLYFKKALERFKVKSRSNPSWPGTLKTICPNTRYKIIFYRTDPGALKILKEVSHINEWSRPKFPEDLAFFKGNQCWFYSVGHELISGIIHADKEDILFLKENGLFCEEETFVSEDDYYDQYDEKLV